MKYLLLFLAPYCLAQSQLPEEPTQGPVFHIELEAGKDYTFNQYPSDRRYRKVAGVSDMFNMELISFCDNGPFQGMSYCTSFVDIFQVDTPVRKAKILEKGGSLIIHNVTGLYWPQQYALDSEPYAKQPPRIEITVRGSSGGMSAPQFYRQSASLRQKASDSIQYDIPQAQQNDVPVSNAAHSRPMRDASQLVPIYQPLYHPRAVLLPIAQPLQVFDPYYF